MSGILLVIIALITIISGGNILFGTVLVISLIGLSELYKVFKIEKKPLGICGYLFTIGYYVLLYMSSLLSKGNHDWFMMLFLGYLICLMAIMVFAYPTYHADQLMAAYFGFKVWLVFICAWGCDTCAYCVGMLIGKHKMAPVLSPKKSIEGGIGGIVGAALIGVLYALAINKWGGAGVGVAEFAIIGAAGGAISQIGDLAASAIKRNYNIKDYGKLIPGHGGILDRFDSVIITAPLIYFLSNIL